MNAATSPTTALIATCATMPPACRVIALLGAESTGKTELAQALAQACTAQGQACMLVTEYLREWCDRAGRVPHRHEQQAIAHEQMRRIAAATKAVAATPGGIVIADTTALMTAIYSDLLFGDATLYDEALRVQRSYAVTLVMALDLPWVADGLQRDGPHAREPVDALLRAALASGGVAYSVVHGQGAQRLTNAMTAVGGTMRLMPMPSSFPAPAPVFSPDTSSAWRCDRCSDPVCERRLFSDLIKQR